MSQGTEYSGYGTTPGAAPATEEIWFVAVAPNDIQQMTLDQLDEAFSAGRITEQTAVWTDGMDQWAPLAEVANLGEEEEAPAPAQVTHPAAAPAQAVPTAAVQPAVHQPAVHQPAVHQPAVHQPGVHQPAVHQPAVHHAPAAAPQLGFQGSTAPVAMSFDEADVEAQPKPRRRVGRWLLAVAGVAAAGIAVVASGLLPGGGSKQLAKKPPAAVLAAQPYEPGPEAKSEKATPKKAVAETVKAAKPTGDAPIGTLGAKDDKSAEDKSEDDEAKAKKASGKSSLKRNFSSAMKKKTKSKRKRSSSKKRRARKASRRSSKKKKKKVKRKSSAFDPLNGSLP